MLDASLKPLQYAEWFLCNYSIIKHTHGSTKEAQSFIYKYVNTLGQTCDIQSMCWWDSKKSYVEKLAWNIRAQYM